jgi:hypothetical protein
MSTACSAILKAWLTARTLELMPRYLQRYLDELVFCFTRRNMPMAAFQTLRGISSQKAPLPLQDLVVLSQPQKHLSVTSRWQATA